MDDAGQGEQEKSRTRTRTVEVEGAGVGRLNVARAVQRESVVKPPSPRSSSSRRSTVADEDGKRTRRILKKQGAGADHSSG